jgi:hypothetical protein
LLQDTAARVCTYAALVRHQDPDLSDRLIDRASDILAELALRLRAQRLAAGH